MSEREYKEIITNQAIMICQLCVRLNPQHKGCGGCDETDEAIPIVEEILGKNFAEAKKGFSL